jgi:hypothetical protein
MKRKYLYRVGRQAYIYSLKRETELARVERERELRFCDPPTVPRAAIYFANQFVQLVARRAWCPFPTYKSITYRLPRPTRHQHHSSLITPQLSPLLPPLVLDPLSRRITHLHDHHLSSSIAPFHSVSRECRFYHENSAPHFRTPPCSIYSTWRHATVRQDTHWENCIH